MQLMFN